MFFMGWVCNGRSRSEDPRFALAAVRGSHHRRSACDRGRLDRVGESSERRLSAEVAL